MVEPPAAWPKPWRGLAAEVEGRLIGAGHALQARVDKAPPAEEIHVRLRLFGEDAAVDARLLQALKARGLPGTRSPRSRSTTGPSGGSWTWPA
ncbi:MAG: hypothetical protein R3F60_08505 [bacterium]